MYGNSSIKRFIRLCMGFHSISQNGKIYAAINVDDNLMLRQVKFIATFLYIFYQFEKLNEF